MDTNRYIRELVRECFSVVKENLESIDKILIPEPPSLEFRVKELPLISYQYHNRFNPEHLQQVLDGDMAEIFNILLVNAGYPAYKPTIEKLMFEIIDVILFHKRYFNSLRPHELAELLDIEFDYDILKTAQTPSYPSGHATQAFYVAGKLSEVFPELKNQLYELAEMIGQSRIDRGVHFPSDIAAGKLLAKKLIDIDR
jgi:hypothetical protein